MKDLMFLMCNSYIAAVFNIIFFYNYHVKYFVIYILNPYFAILFFAIPENLTFNMSESY